MRGRRIALQIIAPVAAIAVALLLSSIALLLIGQNPLAAFGSMLDYGIQPNSLVSMANRSLPLFLSGLAVAIGFKMNLFNIGVEGQYRLAGLMAAWAGAAVVLPAPLHVLFIMLVAMAVGGAWAGIAGVLKVRRGVHEVISTIMLNFIAFGVANYLFQNHFKQQNAPGDLLAKTPEIPPSGQIGPLDALGLENVFGFVPIAVVIGIAFYVLVWKTRFGYDLRASGANPDAARISGVSPGRMVITTMLLSGALAGLVGLPELLGEFHRFTLDFPPAYGFAGIAVALVGRNHPVGIALAAVLFSFIRRSAQILDLEGVPKEIIQIMEGIIILSVVIAYEVVRHILEASEVRAAAERTRRAEPAEASGEVTA